MKIALVGADLEENLGIGMIAAVAERAGHRVSVVPFNEGLRLESVVSELLALGPQVIGLSVQFQHRATEFVHLARELRARGFGGHLTAGGQYPTLAWSELLSANRCIDSVVLHDGEESFVELLAALAAGAPPREVAGLAIRDAGAEPRSVRTAGRRLADDLDRYPFPARYRPHSRHLDIPFIPVMGARGCWGRCTYCSITSTYRDARAHGGGRMLRHRSPENIAAEMAQLLARERVPRAIFCFHDDSFLLPRPAASLARVRAIREALDARVRARVGLIGKCRPDSLTPELARKLRELGVVRLYLGVENTSAPGLVHLGRGVRGEQVRAALAACREAGIFVCYNLLIFEPEATLDDVAANLAFIREHPDHPVNFGRAEPYLGTPLQRRLAADGNLSGDYLGHGYRLRDDRCELLFRICASAFCQRNYDAAGVHNRAMGVGYMAALLEHFFGDRRSADRRAAIAAEAGELTRRLMLESAGFLEQALALAAGVALADHDRIERETALLGLEIARADGRWHRELDRFYRAAEALAAEHSTSRLARSTAAAAKRAVQVVQGVALASLLVAGAPGCDSKKPIVVDPDVGRLDGPQRDRPIAVDPDVGRLDRPPVVDPDVGRLDRPRRDGGVDQPRPRDAGKEPMIVDPPPPPDAKIPQAALIDRWRDTAARRPRTADLPLSDPPAVRLECARGEQGVEVTLAGAVGAISTRWEAEGTIVGDGTAVRWFPSGEDDQIRVGVRSAGGVAVLALRARDLPPADRERG